MDTRKKFVICSLITLLFDLETYIMAYSTPLIYMSVFQMCLFRYVLIIPYYMVQILLLYYAEKLNSRILYVFPIYWGMEIWRLWYRNIVWENLIYKSTDFGDFMYKWVTPLFWGADWLPYLHVFTYSYHGFPMSIFGDDVIKLVVSVVAFIIACRYAIMQYRKGKAA